MILNASMLFECALMSVRTVRHHQDFLATLFPHVFLFSLVAQKRKIKRQRKLWRPWTSRNSFLCQLKWCLPVFEDLVLRKEEPSNSFFISANQMGQGLSSLRGSSLCLKGISTPGFHRQSDFPQKSGNPIAPFPGMMESGWCGRSSPAVALISVVCWPEGTQRTGSSFTIAQSTVHELVAPEVALSR